MSVGEHLHNRAVLGRVFVVDDDQDSAELLAELLVRHKFEATALFSGSECLSRLASERVDVVVTDISMPGMSGIELCTTIRRLHPDVTVLVLTGNGGFDVAVEALRAGAFDYVSKPVNAEVMFYSVSRAAEHARLRRELARLRAISVDARGGGRISGESAAIRGTIDLVHRLAVSDATVLITGESGTGKELVARALHEESPRAAHRFLAINCAAMPPGLLESELFGHTSGAFTDAKTSRIGLFATAGRGTVLLDEIGEMPLEVQVKLLRVLQERVFRPVGADVEVPFHARVISATSRNLDNEVLARRFREDLLYRVRVVEIAVPPLRKREGDVLLLAHSFLRQISARTGKPVRGITPDAARLMMAYDWPGNVRELENCMERAIALCRLDQIIPDDLPKVVHGHPTSAFIPPAELSSFRTLADTSQRYVEAVLALTDNNKTHTARILDIDRRSVYRHLAAAQREIAP